MSKCIRRTQGGKGNEGRFIERAPEIYAAGKPTAQSEEHMADYFKWYLLQDEIEAVVNDAIIPIPEVPKFLPPKQPDTRNAGPFSDVRACVNPPQKTKFMTLVEDFKNTSYASYWRKGVGERPDGGPMLPEGFDFTKPMGIKTEASENLYDVIMPKDRVLGTGPPKNGPGYQIDRNYNKPAYDPTLTFGIRTRDSDKRGTYTKCCLIQDNCRTIPMSAILADFKRSNEVSVGLSLSPNDNIKCVPTGHAFGILKPPDNLPECLTMCKLNIGKQLFLKCLSHLNTLRKSLSKNRQQNFFRRFYLNLKYLDKEKTKWLPKQDIYDLCSIELVRVNPTLIEPLLEMWGAFDGAKIQYKMFVYIINFKEPLPTLSKVLNIPEECIEYSTTYTDMMKPGQDVDNRPRAGVPSGRYFDTDYPVIPDGYCKADISHLPQESDVRTNISPSTYTLIGITHRDLYAKRSPELIRSTYEKAGVSLTDEKFNTVWEEAKQYHSQGWVCFETFRKAFNKIVDGNTTR